jgi:6-phosphofructokinase
MADVDLKRSDDMPQRKVFVSYHFGEHEAFITQICYFLDRQGVRPYFHRNAPILEGVPDWRTRILAELKEADAVLLFYGNVLGDTQEEELRKAEELEKHVIPIALPTDQPRVSITHRVIATTIYLGGVEEDDAFFCAKRCCELLKVQWMVEDDIPDGYPFDYERAIINVYLKNKVDSYLVSQGCPREWPQITRKRANIENRVSESDVGKYRDVDNEGLPKSQEPQVFVDTTSDFSPVELNKRKMVLSLAGPRKLLHFPCDREEPFNVGVLVSGGIAPGTNAVISAIVERHALYAARGAYDYQVLGYCDGFRGLLRPVSPIALDRRLLEKTFDQGGSILGTSRLPAFVTGSRQERNRCLERAVSKIEADGIQILYVIGGDGSMRAAHVLWKRIEQRGSNISVVTIPKTMDNDVLWGWQTFGFESAVEKANEIIHQVHVEAESNPRLGVLQLFGSDSGYVVTHAALASGLCNLFLIPEVPFSMRWVWNFMAKQAKEMAGAGANQGPRPYRWHGLVLMAEAAIPIDAQWYVDREEVALTKAEKEEVREYLHLDYWDRPFIDIPQASVKRIQEYLGFDQKCGYDGVEALHNEDRLYVREYARRLRTKGQTPDGLRSAGLKLVSRVLQERFHNDAKQLQEKYWRDFRVFTNEPRHAIRAVSPRSSDILFAHRLGTLAVDGAMAGYTDFMISQWLTEYVMVPLRLVVLGRKRVPEKGIFYCSARASTGQPPDLL